MLAILKEKIAELKLERSILRDGGYGRSVRTPRKPERLLRDSVNCLNFGEAEKRHPCSEHFLLEWVPPEHRNEEMPCHFIPLNERGDTVHSLEAAGDREEAERLLLDWLDSTIAQLERQLAQQQVGVTEGEGNNATGC